MTAGRKLLGAASSRSFRCLWMIEELGIPYEHVPVLPQSDVVKKHNPLGKIPVLVEDDGWSLYESAAINTYLGDAHKEKGLVPFTGTRQRAWYDETISVLSSELDAQGLWIHRKHEALGHIFSFAPMAVAHARKYFNKTNKVLMKKITQKEGGPYLLGKTFTAADIFYVHCLDWSTAIGWDDKWKKETLILQYVLLCKSRPAYKTVKAIKDAEEQDSKKQIAARKDVKKDDNVSKL